MLLSCLNTPTTTIPEKEKKWNITSRKDRLQITVYEVYASACAQMREFKVLTDLQLSSYMLHIFLNLKQTFINRLDGQISK